MIIFDDCECVYENKFVYDVELNFKVEVCCNCLLGEWVVGFLGMNGDDVCVYVLIVVILDFDELGDEDVYCKFVVDLLDKFDEVMICVKMVELCVIVCEQILKES